MSRLRIFDLAEQIMYLHGGKWQEVIFAAAAAEWIRLNGERIYSRNRAVAPRLVGSLDRRLVHRLSHSNKKRRWRLRGSLSNVKKQTCNWEIHQRECLLGLRKYIAGQTSTLCYPLLYWVVLTFTPTSVSEDAWRTISPGAKSAFFRLIV